MDFSLISNGKIKYYDFIISDQIDIKTSLTKILGFFGKNFVILILIRFFCTEGQIGTTRFFFRRNKDIPVTLMNPFKTESE